MPRPRQPTYLRSLLLLLVVLTTPAGAAANKSGAREPLSRASQDAQPPSAASPAEVPARMSLREALGLALAHSATLRVSATAVANARSRLVSTAQLDELTLEASASRTTSTRTRSTTLATAGGTYDRDFRRGMTLSLSGVIPWADSDRRGGQGALELSLPLLRGRGKTSARQVAIDQAAIGFDRERLRYFVGRQQLIEQVVGAYFHAVQGRERIEIQKQAVAIAQQATDDAQKRLDAGLITEIDLTRAKIRLATTRETLLNLEAAYRNALDDLVLLLGLPVGATPELTDPAPAVPLPEGEPADPAAENAGEEGPVADRPPAANAPSPDPPVDLPPAELPAHGIGLEAAIREALANRPELKLRELEEEEARIQQQVARDQRRPRADLTANLVSGGLALLTRSNVGTFLTSLLGIRLSVPVNRVALRESQATAERNLAVLARLREFDRQEVVEEVRALVRAQETARSNIVLLTQNLKVAQQSLRLAQRLIEEGLADNRNLLDAQGDLTSTQSSLISARIDYYLTSVGLARALGRDLLQEFDLPAVEPLLAVQSMTPETGSAQR